MKNLLGGNRNENLVAVVTGSLSLLLLILVFRKDPAISLPDLILALILVAAIVLADRYPIHVRYATKVSMTSVPLFLSAALLPRPVAMLAGVAGMFLAGFLMRKERGMLPIDFITDPSRWAIILFVAGSVVHLIPRTEELSLLLVIASAAIMFCADVLTFSFFTSLTTGEPISILVKQNTVQIFLVESIQYIIGILGVLAYFQAFWSLILLLVPIIITYRVFKNLKEMNSGTRSMLVNMADTVDLRDPYTGGHSRRVTELTVKILRQMQILGLEVDLIGTAARLHDIGKIAISDAILLKPGKLTPEEWQVMQSHSEKGSLLLSSYPDFTRGAEIVLRHHERWDGKGYPNGLKEHAIPIGSRIIAVADSFDAMTTDRPYRPKMTVEQALDVLRSGRGGQWDPDVVDQFILAWEANPE